MKYLIVFLSLVSTSSFAGVWIINTGTGRNAAIGNQATGGFINNGEGKIRAIGDSGGTTVVNTNGPVLGSTFDYVKFMKKDRAELYFKYFDSTNKTVEDVSKRPEELTGNNAPVLKALKQSYKIQNWVPLQHSGPQPQGVIPSQFLPPQGLPPQGLWGK